METIQVMHGEETNRKIAKPRILFGALGLFAIAIAAAAFVPEYLRFAAGDFPIATVLHIHGAVMGAWLAMFVLQAWLAASGRVALHRKIGPYGIALGIVAWASTIVVEVRGLVVHPLPVDGTGYDELLQDVYSDAAFIVLLLWAAYERRRPAWHKRLMAIAMFVTLLASIERIEWLPQLGIGYIWASVLWLNVFLTIPLVAYDMVSEKRLHPATLQGLGIQFAAQAMMWLAWGTTPWRLFAFSAAHTLRSAFQL